MLDRGRVIYNLEKLQGQLTDIKDYDEHWAVEDAKTLIEELEEEILLQQDEHEHELYYLEEYIEELEGKLD